MYIVEFDNNVRSKDQVSNWCKAKMGHGAYVKIEEIRKIKKEDFSVKDYEKRLAKLEKKKAMAKNLGENTGQVNRFNVMYKLTK